MRYLKLIDFLGFRNSLYLALRTIYSRTGQVWFKREECAKALRTQKRDCLTSLEPQVWNSNPWWSLSVCQSLEFIVWTLRPMLNDSNESFGKIWKFKKANHLRCSEMSKFDTRTISLFDGLLSRVCFANLLWNLGVRMFSILKSLLVTNKPDTNLDSDR